jgi:hypothetical protein
VVDQAVEEAKQSPVPLAKDLWTDIYYKNTEPPSMRGREREEVRVTASFFGGCSNVVYDRYIIIEHDSVADVCAWEGIE